MVWRIAITAFALCGFSASTLASQLNAEAGASGGHVYLGGFAMDLDEARGTEGTGSGIQVNLGWVFAQHWALEGHFFSADIETGTNRGTDFYHRGLGVDMQYAFGNRESITPFLLLGLGVADNDVVPDARDDQTLFYNAGIGLVGRLFRLNWLRWRVEGRYQYDDFLDGVNDWRLGAGLEIAFARQAPGKVVVQEREVIKEVVKEVMPPDTDGDGVVDYYDRCPSTLSGAQVNGFGCVEKAQTITLRNINFEFDSARLTPDAATILMQAVSFLREQPELYLEVGGHTDALGSAAYNQKLSQDRASAVRSALISDGISPTRIRAVGYGESQLLDSADTEAAHALNRRVEFRLDMMNR